MLTSVTSSVKPLLSLLKRVAEGWKEQQRSSPALPCQSFEALKVLTQSQEQRIWGKASPGRAELVRPPSKRQSRAQNWCSYDTMAVLMTTHVNQFALSTYTMMIKQISFSMRTYGNSELWRLWVAEWINTKQFDFSTCYLSNVFIAFNYCLDIQELSISTNSKILTGTEKRVVLYFRSYPDKELGKTCSVEIKLDKN